MSGFRQVVARPFGFPYEGPIVPARTALLVIDLQVDFLSPEGYFARKGYDPGRLRAILPTVNALVGAARRAGCAIVHTRQGYRADGADLTPYEQWRRARSGMAGTRALMRGQPGFDLVPELDVAPADIIVDKTANGAFTHTDLDHILRARGISHLMLAGCTTDVCVHTTQREAVDRNYQCLLVEDACASGDDFAHRAAIHMTQVEDGIFGVVAPAAAVIAALAP
ncbi:cysteine hydrolase family protein [Zavarzinia compransoris]|uniref:Cysteine hydrolase n=1 Tax=Zavarzinia compransoris TaxID=1264899 RepID=A0A317E840_9PROT|nr:isochorismatase family cysteine hydrolase [Zavarzinia compransoris]PWR23308.1 cysteine hydrolase [Zavarzinia compransoris]TDP46121.1 nicotinamidase-related amidase [Zavarzinia compransoris]